MIGVNYSSEGYYLEVNDATERTAPLREKLVQTSKGMTFKALDEIPSYAVIGQNMGKFAAKSTRTIADTQRLEYLKEHGFTIDVQTGLIIPVVGLWQGINGGTFYLTLRGLPQPYSLQNGKMLTGAFGAVDAFGVFKGRLSYENSQG